MAVAGQRQGGLFVMRLIDKTLLDEVSGEADTAFDRETAT
jgi:hypothetical protein